MAQIARGPNHYRGPPFLRRSAECHTVALRTGDRFATSSFADSPRFAPPFAANSGLKFELRGVAQPGRALGSGPRGRWFKSSLPDFVKAAVSRVILESRSLRFWALTLNG